MWTGATKNMMIVKDLFPWWSLFACICISLVTLISIIFMYKYCDRGTSYKLALIFFMSICVVFWLTFYQEVKHCNEVIEVSDELISAHELFNKYEILGDYPGTEDWYIARRR